MPSPKAPYAETSLDEEGLREFARKAAAVLREGNIETRGPRPETTTTEAITEGSLFKRRHRTVTHHDNGGEPRFWVLLARREDGMFRVNTPGQAVSTWGWLRGDAALLLENGDLASAHWREEPIGAIWTFSDIGEMTAHGIMMFDHADVGSWCEVRPVDHHREQQRKEFRERVRREAGYKGGALFDALKVLWDREWVRVCGYPTGMQHDFEKP